MEDPPKKFFRLAPGREVRLRYAYFVTCIDVVKDGDRVVELRCSYDPATRGGDSPDGRKVKGTLHWVSAEHALPAQVRLYDTLVQRRGPGQSDRGRRPDGRSQSRVPQGCQCCAGRAQSRHGQSWNLCAIRTSRLLLRGSGFESRGCPRLQPHRESAGKPGQKRPPKK